MRLVANVLKLPGPFFKSKEERMRGILRPDPIFILGMHRSGTSALGGVLEPLGLTVGKTVMLPREENPKGFYENIPLTEFHDEFLAFIGSRWDDPQPVALEKFQGETARRFQTKLLRLLIKEFKSNRPLIKDPRLCRLMPLWTSVIEEHFSLARFILPIRNPVEVAHSLQKHHQLALGQGVKLWVIHVLEAEKTTRNYSRLFTTYDQLMQAPVETLFRLANDLGLSTDAVQAIVSNRIDFSLRHHQQLPWPDGEPHQELIQSIHQALVSEEPGKEEKLDGFRQEYYGEMGWRY